MPQTANHSSIAAAEQAKYRLQVRRTAEAILRGRSTGDPDRAEHVYLRGRVTGARGDVHAARACLVRAAALEPGSATYHAELADLLIRTGHTIEALRAYRQALRLAPDEPDLHCGLGRALLQHGHVGEATACYQRAVQLAPTDARVQGELGDVLVAGAHLDEALACHEQSVQLAPDDADNIARLGRTQLHRRQWAIAANTFRRGLQLQPSRADLHVGLGQALLRLRHPEDALRACRAALALRPRDISACRLLISVFELLHIPDERAEAWYALGAALELFGRLREAEVAYRETLSHTPGHLGALVGLGCTHLQLAQPRQAVPLLEAVLDSEPEHATARFALGRCLAHIGELADGWEHLCWFDDHGPAGRWHFEQPVWDGSPLDGRTLLLWTKAGLGDVIQVIRYAPLVRARGGRVVVLCHDRLVPLMERMASIDVVIAAGMPLPQFDAHAEMSLLPLIFKTSLTAVPDRVPYLPLDQVLIEAWRQRLGSRDKRTIGLVWSGDRRGGDTKVRFSSLREFEPLAALSGVRFISLQHGLPALELLDPPRGLRIEMFPDECRSLDETAALIRNLDLVISVDTMVAHLAGALGTPVWTLLAHSPESRWMIEGDRSPWYPTMRLFRQTRPGDWLGVVHAVRAALEERDSLPRS